MHLFSKVGIVLFVTSTIASASANVTAKRYAILDNDWASNSFVPFLMAVDAGIEVLALTSSTADTWQKQAAYHALALLEIGNLSCIPVVSGATHPLINTYARFQAWLAVHGTTPYQGVFAPYNATAEASGFDPTAGHDPDRIEKSAFVEGFPNTKLLEGKNAASFMVEQVRKYPGQVSIYAAGAMTNVALAVRMDDQFARLAKELVIQGGYLDVNALQASGSLSQAAINTDVNLLIDPEAAKIALNAPFPSVTLAGNVANQVLVTPSFLDEIYEVKNVYTKLVHDYYASIYSWWDECAIALLIEPGLGTNSSTYYVDVDTAYASPSYGTLRVYQEALKPPGSRKVTYWNSIDQEGFLQKIKHAVQYPKTCADL